MSNVEMDPSKFRSTMSSLNYGSVMEAAARNLQKARAPRVCAFVCRLPVASAARAARRVARWGR